MDIERIDWWKEPFEYTGQITVNFPSGKTMEYIYKRTVTPESATHLREYKKAMEQLEFEKWFNNSPTILNVDPLSKEELKKIHDSYGKDK